MTMTTTEQRLVDLAHEHLGIDPSPGANRTLAETGVSSIDLVAFLKVVGKEFNVTSLNAGDCDGVETLRDLAALVDSQTG